jgi:integral membrane protein
MPVTEQTAADDLRPDRGVQAALRRYRFLAYVVGVGLLVLVFIGVPLQYGANVPQVAEIVGPIHGALYIVYLATAVDLARRTDIRTRQLLAIVLAGFVPFVAFIVERRISRSVERGLRDAGMDPEPPV